MTDQAMGQPDPGFSAGRSLAVVRRRLGWRGWLLLGGAIVVAGLALNWSWLVAAGVAPILLSLLPCTIMCALGLCMKKTGAGVAGSHPVRDVAGTDNPLDAVAPMSVTPGMSGGHGKRLLP